MTGAGIRCARICNKMSTGLFAAGARARAAVGPPPASAEVRPPNKHYLFVVYCTVFNDSYTFKSLIKMCVTMIGVFVVRYQLDF